MPRWCYGLGDEPLPGGRVILQIGAVPPTRITGPKHFTTVGAGNSRPEFWILVLMVQSPGMAKLVCKVGHHVEHTHLDVICQTHLGALVRQHYDIVWESDVGRHVAVFGGISHLKDIISIAYAHVVVNLLDPKAAVKPLGGPDLARVSEIILEPPPSRLCGCVGVEAVANNAVLPWVRVRHARILVGVVVSSRGRGREGIISWGEGRLPDGTAGKDMSAEK